MLDPLTIMAIVVGIKAIVALIAVALLTFQQVVAWFKDRQALMSPDQLAVSVQAAMSDGTPSLVQGIFDKRTQQFTDGRRINYQQLDPTLSEYHQNDQVVMYN